MIFSTILGKLSCVSYFITKAVEAPRIFLLPLPPPCSSPTLLRLRSIEPLYTPSTVLGADCHHLHESSQQPWEMDAEGTRFSSIALGSLRPGWDSASPGTVQPTGLRRRAVLNRHNQHSTHRTRADPRSRPHLAARSTQHRLTVLRHQPVPRRHPHCDTDGRQEPPPRKSLRVSL